MPELPEVETTARSLRPGLLGRVIVDVRAIDYAPLVEPLTPQAFAAAVTGRTIQQIGRRGKFLLLQLDSTDVLAIHLRMSGRLYLVPREGPVDRHTHAILDLDNGRSLHFHVPRKFGRMRLLTTAQYEALDAQLGPEPLAPSFTARALVARLQSRPRARLKALLLDQRFIAGLGNIYADESLFRAGLQPLRASGSLSPEETEHLYKAITEVLSEAIAAEGTTLADGVYLFGPGEAGRFAARLQVYGRPDQPCPRCGDPIRRQVVAGRSTHFCPRCQV